MLPTIKTIISKNPGPVVTVMGGIHGNEPTGVEVVKYLIDTQMEIDCGKLHLIIANNKAIEADVRYIDNNLNRCFGSSEDLGLEGEIATIISEYLDQSDYLLDLHNTVKNDSPRFSICTDSKFISTFDVAYCALEISDIHTGCTDEYMKKSGKSAICLECGWVGSGEDHFAITLKDVINFLVTIGTLNKEGGSNVYEPKIIQFDGIYTTKHNFVLGRNFLDFEKIKAGTIIGKDGEEEIYFPYDGYILFAMNQSSSNQEGFIYGKG